MSKNRNTDNQFAFDLDDAPDLGKAAPEATSNRNTSLALNETTTVLELLDNWQQADWIRPLDVRFARLIHDLSEEQGEAAKPLVLLLAALTSHQVGRGHVCVDLANLLADADSTLSLPPEEPNGTIFVQNRRDSVGSSADLSAADTSQIGPGDLLARICLQECLSALGKALAVSDGLQTTPLVLNGTRLYLRRFWRYEQQDRRRCSTAFERAIPFG